MVRHKPTSKVVSNDLCKLKFKPGKFIIVKTNKTTPIPCNSTAMALDQNKESTASTSGICTKNTVEITVPTKNQFQTLENVEEMDVVTLSSEKPTSSKSGSAKTKTEKPPPIVIHRKIPDHSVFIAELQSSVKKGFHIKNSRYNTNVFIYDTEEYRNYLQTLEEKTEDFHTYTEKSRKTHAFILKGIDSKPSPEEIQQDIEEKHNFKIKNVYKLKNTSRDIYLVITDNSIYLKFLVANVKYICHTKISWERHINRSPVLQCRRCQKWGHSTNNCRSKPICTKCGAQHWTKDCTTVDKEKEETHQNIKCANCQGNHLAFSKDCPAYLKRLEDIERRKNKLTKPAHKKPVFVPAPEPTTNPWKNQTATTSARRMGITPTTNMRSNYVSSVISHQVGSSLPQNSNPQTNFSSLLTELNVLNQLIDLEKMVRLVRELNLHLRGCTNELEKFLKFHQFCQNSFEANEISALSCQP